MPAKLDRLIVQLQPDGSYDWSVILKDTVQGAFGPQEVSSGAITPALAIKLGANLDAVMSQAHTATLAQVTDLQKRLDGVIRSLSTSQISASEHATAVIEALTVEGPSNPLLNKLSGGLLGN